MIITARSHNFSARQLEMMAYIRKGTPDGGFVDFTSMKDEFALSRQALESAINMLIRAGVVRENPKERRNGRWRRIILPDAGGLSLPRQ